jgi:hypothetical protein
VLDKWIVTTRDEEQVILQQFLRFGETKSIAQEIILQDTRDNRERQIVNSPKTESEIKKFIERSNMSMHSYLRNYETLNRLNRQMASQYPATSPGSSTPRMLSPSSALPSYSPTSSREPVNMTITGTTSPVTSSPLSRLQTMQPFDYRRDHISPTVSPVTSEKSITHSIGSKSPGNMSLSSTTTPPAPSLTPTSMSVVSGGKAESLDDVKYVLAPSSEDSNDEAINYSLKNNNNNNNDCHSSVYSDRKVKHLRKSANPMKRPWQPTASFGTTFISPSGKKRVLCTACNKTFCDKGALKIHYSAVHLKEMHKCTVEGCNMMFSSRRSRNRHSSNPNPKLHMPNAKHKLPEGCTVLNDPPPPNLPTSLPGLHPPIHISPLSLPMSLSPEEKHVPHKFDHPLPSSHDSGPPLSEQRYYLDPNGHVSMFASPSKVAKLDHVPDSLRLPTSLPQQLFPSFGLTLPVQIKQEPEQFAEPSLSSRSSRKRKSMIPTRCAQQPDDGYVMSDDGEEAVSDAQDEADMPQNLSIRSQREDADEMMEEEEEESAKKDCGEDGQGCTDQKAALVQSSFHEIQQKAIKQMDSISPASLGEVCSDDGDKPEDSLPAEQDKEEGELSFHMSTGIKNGKHLDDNDVEQNEDIEHNSDADSNCSMDSNDNHDFSNGKEDDSDIPLDKENPRKCSGCGKMFQNHFGLKTHYQNVHLKLMHNCTVDGCNAAFPSKRSRDRHSSNLNLHRKLLSTSSDEGEKTPPKHLLGQSLRDEFLPRLYDSHHFNNAISMRYNREEENNHSNLTAIVAMTNNGILEKPHSPIYNGNGEMNSEDQIYFADLENGGEGHEDGESPQPDPDGMVKCHICKQRFRDNLVLKEHYEKVHPKEMYHCTVSGCDKIFSTRKSRNRHSQNENLHKLVSPIKTNGTP